MGIFDFYQNWTNKKIVSRLSTTVSEINQLESKVQKLKETDFAIEIKKIKKELLDKRTTLDQSLPYVFALTREAARRTLGQRHFDQQLMGGMVLHQKGIAEMKTGEGKTLSSTLPIVLNALSGKGVHLITVNDYLARRDASWMGPVYDLLGLSIGVIQQQGGALIYDSTYGQEQTEDNDIVFVDVEHLRPGTRKEAYDCDITYGTNSEFGFDYLRDNMTRSANEMVQRPLNFAIIDEVDSVLIDEARTPLIISAPAEEAEDLYQTFARLVSRLNPETDYAVDEKEHAVTLNDEGTNKVESLLSVSNIYDPIQTQKYGGAAATHYLYEALQAKALYQKNKDYIVKEGAVVIVDEFTGRLMPDRRYSEGLHQAIEAKEGVKIKQESLTLATISLQNYFRLYKKLAGMTGTAATESEEFRKIYDLEVVTIPTHRPMVRNDHADLIYKTETGKFEAVVKEIQKRNKKKQPILVGTLSIAKSERLSKMLKMEGIKHEVLNAKHHEHEAKIIAKAGQLGAVTIATNMAGRGVDIILEKGAIDLGGLCVIGTERHESRRIDNQLRGRAGRQGDPGESIFFVSLEDDLMRIFGGDRIKNMMTILKVPEDQPIQSNMVSRGLESAQKKVEAYNFDIRKHLLEFDNVLNKQREKIYRERRGILKAKDLEEKVKEILNDSILYASTLYFANSNEAKTELLTIFPEEDLITQIKKIKPKNEEDLYRFLDQKAKTIFKEKKNLFAENFNLVLKQIYLSSIDSLWIDHLTTMDQLRQSVGLRGYGQKDPLTEYKKESYRLFQDLNAAFKDQVAKVILKIIPAEAQIEQKQQNIRLNAPTEKLAAGGFNDVEQTESENEMVNSDQQIINQNYDSRIGRNDPCPCGSGKKYKKCHLGKTPGSQEQALFNLYCDNPKEWEKQTDLKIKVKK